MPSSTLEEYRKRKAVAERLARQRAERPLRWTAPSIPPYVSASTGTRTTHRRTDATTRRRP